MATQETPPVPPPSEGSEEKIEAIREIVLEHAYSEEMDAALIKEVKETKVDSVVTDTPTDAKDIMAAEQLEASTSKIELYPEKVKSRELKSLLEAAKESNLDTNIVHKRESRRNFDVYSKRSLDSDSIKRAMRSQNPEFAAKQQKFLHSVKQENENGQDDDYIKKEKDYSIANIKTSKKRKDTSADSTPGGSVAEERRTRKSMKLDALAENMRKKGKDTFCWRCHREGVTVACETCPRSYHPRCLKTVVQNAERWTCPECVCILQAESTRTRSQAMRGLTLEHLCDLLKFAVKRMIGVSGVEPFLHPVDTKTFPDYENYVVHPMDLTTMENNIRNGNYGSTIAFTADAKWMLHNSIIFNSSQSKLTQMAKSLIKICKQEMYEIETCAECYLNANTKPASWFVEVCSKPHVLLWAKLKGFPYWPAKAMIINNNAHVDVRFFGAHDRAWIPLKDCYLYCKKDPNTTNKVKRNNIVECIKEVNIYIRNMRDRHGDFYYAPYRTPYDPESELEQLTYMLPGYKPIDNATIPRRIVAGGIAQPLTSDDESKTKKAKGRTSSEEKKKRPRTGNEAGDRSSSELDQLSILMNYPHKEKDKFIDGFESEDDDEMDDTDMRKKVLPLQYESDEDADDQPLLVRTDNVKSGKAVKRYVNKKVHPTRGGTVRTRGGYQNLTGRVKVLTSIERRKRVGSPANQDINAPRKQRRRNSEVSSKSDSSRLSSISDKLNRSEDVETIDISFPSGTLPDCSTSDKKVRPEFAASIHPDTNKNKSTVQVNSGELYKNKVYKIISQNKAVSMAEKLMKKIAKQDEKGEDTRPRASPASKTSEADTTGKMMTSTSGQNVDQVQVKIEAEDDDIPTSSDKITNESADKRNENNGARTPVTSTPLRNASDREDFFKDRVTVASIRPTETNDTNKRDTTANTEKNNGKIASSAKLTNISDMPTKDNLAALADKENLYMGELLNDSIEIKSEPTSEPDEEGSPNEEERGTRTNGNENNSGSNQSNSTTSAEVCTSTSSSAHNSTSPNSSPKASTANCVATSNASVATSSGNSVNTSASTTAPTSTSTSTSTSSTKPFYDVTLTLVDKKKETSAVNNTHQPNNSDQMPFRMDSFKPTNVNKEIERPKAPTPPSLSFNRKEITLRPISKLIYNQKQKARKTFPNSPHKMQQIHLKRLGGDPRDFPLKPPTIVPSKPPPLMNTPTTQLSLGTVSKDAFGGSVMVVTPTPSAPTAAIGPVSFTITPQVLPPPNLVFQATNAPSVQPPSNPGPSSASDGPSTSSMVAPNTNMPGPSSSMPGPSSTMPGPSSTMPGPSSNMSGPSSMPGPSGINGPSCSRQPQEQTGTVAEIMNRAINDILNKPMPTLKPRPPGPLSNDFEEGLPSNAGPTTSLINSVSHRLTDYMRALLKEILNEMGMKGVAEARIATLELELESIKYRHQEEMAEVKKNLTATLKDVQRSVAEERNRAIEETRTQCEAERIRCVEEAKSKQWCAYCSKEAAFYCCWNTSYCDFQCQQNHWSTHVKTCSHFSLRNDNGDKPSTPPAPVKLIPKHTYSNSRSNAKPPRMVMKPPAKPMPLYLPVQRQTPGNAPTLTLVESKPGSYEIVGNNAFQNKIIPTSSIKVKPGSVITVSNPPTSSSTSTLSGNTKAILFAPKNPFKGNQNKDNNPDTSKQ